LAGPEVPRLRRSVPVMGTVATVEIAFADSDSDGLIEEVFDWFRQVDARFSPFRPDSEVCRFDRGELGTGDCSADLLHVIERSAELWRETDGYFDVHATGRFDPSGYVKGWSVQRASELLSAAGAADHLVDVGGDIQTRGRPAPDAHWEIGVRHPFEPSKVCWVVTGTDLAVATSGTYERGYHIVDPRTGQPARVLRAVTVVGTDLATTDAYATAALAMGMSSLTWLARLDGYESGVITETGECFTSAGLARLSTVD
jgi:thiamine biosynthesis lipoprotein